jgi:ribonucleotide monophosphatase NagD (HAD superfamily)
MTCEYESDDVRLYTEPSKCRGILPEEAVMVGDDVMQDVEGANAIGIHSVLVRTGKYRPGDETRSAPTFTANDFSHAVEWVLERVHQEED